MLPVLLWMGLLRVAVTASTATTTASSTANATKTTADNYELPTLFMDSYDYKIYYVNATIGENALDGNADTHYGPDSNLMGLRLDLISDRSWIMDSRYFISCEERYDSAESNETLLTRPGVNYDDLAINPCGMQGIYNISDSTSVNTTENQFSILEMNYIYFLGDVIYDTITFENESITIDSMAFVALNSTDVYAGGLGLLSTANDSTGYGMSFFDALKNSGIVNSSLYSLYLGRLYSESMELHLGGLDTSKLRGEFVEFDFIPYYDMENVLRNDLPILPLTGMSVTSLNSDLSASLGVSGYYPLLLDSRTYYSYLPYSMVIDMLLQLNAYYSSSLDRWLVDCSIGNLYLTVDFKFGSLAISIRISELIYDLVDDDGTSLIFQSTGASLCYVSVLPSEEDGFVLLGTPFLRSIYLSVDNEGRKLAIGQLYIPYYDDGLTIEEILSSDSVVALRQSSTSTTSTSSSSSKTSSTTKAKRDQTGETDLEAGSTTLTSLATALSSAISYQPSSDTDLITSLVTSMATSLWGSTKTLISSGHIPFLTPNSITDYEDLTLTMSFESSGGTHSNTRQVVVSNGEIILDGSSATASTSRSASGLELSNLVSSGNGAIQVRPPALMQAIIASPSSSAPLLLWTVQLTFVLVLLSAVFL